jgi:hypothetical protein
LRAVSKLARPIQEAFFKWVNRNKIARQAKGKPPMDAARRVGTAGAVATTGAAGVGVGKYLADEGLLPRIEHVGGGRLQPSFPSDEQAAAGPEVVPEVSSKASQYIERASQKLEMMTKFDQEERLYKIWRDVYYDQDGNYDAPASKKEAAERARRLGASPEETQKIYGWAEEQDDLVEWWRTATNEQGYETTTTHGKKERPPQGAGARWNMGSPPDRLVAPTAKTPPGYVAWTDGKTTTPVLKGQLGPAGFWPGTAGSTSGTHNERVEAKAAEFLGSDQDDARAIAVYENYYRSAKDQFGNLAFPDRLGAKQAAIEAVENLKIQLRMQPGTAAGGGDLKKYTSKKEVEADVRAANPKPSHVSQDEYEVRIAAQVNAVWREQQQQ